VSVNADVEARVTQVYRDEWARIVGGLTRRCGDLDLAEEMAAEAFASAAERWPDEGVPPNPAGWITTTASRKAIDRLRRESFRDAKQREALMLHDPEPPESTGVIDDDRLRLLFTCCHPALSLEARVALTLRIVGGLTVEEIARAFLIQESAVRQRITRAKAKIKTERIPYRMPGADDLRIRIDGVLAVLYLICNEGYFASGPGMPALRRELTGEAIRLTGLLRELVPDDAEVAGLLALMLLSEARAAARITAGGELARLDEQDRGAWNRELIDRGLALLDEPLAAAPGRHRLLAEINAVHVRATDAEHTDWARIVGLYEQLERIDSSPVVTLSKAVAVAERDSPEEALPIVEALRDALDQFHAFHVTLAELLRAAGRPDDARAAYARGIALADNTAEIIHLTRRRDELAAPFAPGESGRTPNGESR
jgi:RNA polymerase sigma-70 factor (ECF subfamily)